MGDGSRLGQTRISKIGHLVSLGGSSLMTAHLIGEMKKAVVINSTEDKDNFQFAWNMFHWLSYALK